MSANPEEADAAGSEHVDRYIGDDHLKMHLQAIGKVALLNASQEVELAKRIEAGLTAQAVLDRVLISNTIDASSEELEWLVQDGQEAFSHFVSANTRLSVSVARKYGYATTSTMQLEDRIQAGNEALFTAVKKFDFKKGYKFSTYATWWLRQGIDRALANEARTIRIPVHMTEKVRKVTRFRQDWLKEHGKEATVEDISKELKIEPDEAKKIIDILRIQPASLNSKVDDTDTELGELLAVAKQGELEISQAVMEIILESIRTEIRASGLTPREQFVIERRFGIGSGEAQTLDDIGKEFGVTRERIRQIEVKAKRILSQSPRLRELFDAFVEDD